MNRILAVILIILLSITIVEAAIYIFHPFEKPKSSAAVPTPTAIEKIPPLPTIAPHMTVKEIADTWNYVWMKGLTDTVMFTTTNRGKLSQLEYSPDRKKMFSHQAQLDFKLDSLTDATASYHFYYKAEDVDKLTVTALVNGQEKKISPKDLKNGDRIILTVTANIFPEQGGKIQSMKIVKEE